MKKFYYLDSFFNITLILLLMYFALITLNSDKILLIILTLVSVVLNFVYFNSKFKIVTKMHKKTSLTLGAGFEFAICIFIKVALMILVLISLIENDINLIVYPFILSIFSMWIFEVYLTKNAYIYDKYLVSLEKGAILLADIKECSVVMNNLKNFDCMNVSIKTKDEKCFQCSLMYPDYKMMEEMIVSH